MRSHLLPYSYSILAGTLLCGEQKSNTTQLLPNTGLKTRPDGKQYAFVT